MKYEFLIIKSKYPYKTKLALSIIFLIIYIFLAGFLTRIFIIDLNFEVWILFICYFILVLFFSLICGRIVDKYEIIGNVLFDSNKLIIFPENKIINYNNIVHIYFSPSSIRGKYKFSMDSYFTKIILPFGKSDVVLNLKRNQLNNKPVSIRKLFNRKDIFSVLKELKIEYSYRKSKNLI